MTEDGMIEYRVAKMTNTTMAFKLKKAIKILLGNYAHIGRQSLKNSRLNMLMSLKPLHHNHQACHYTP
ncbi:hypothetical protein Hanom_Chr17g01570821 [Helianthus anomalus]